ncbi:MAG: hydrogenase iron-sulfur subunit [Chloroflexi bacterium]|nr:hydrogenase iron-sulfur subunit [Chloroflexota bacterium]
MDPTSELTKPKILILATLSGGYAGANAVGQLHVNYAANTSILPVRCPSMFSEKFYLDTFEQGIDGIIVMYSGTDSPYKGGPDRAAKLINQTYIEMKARGINTRRLRLAAICTVCTTPFQKEVALMDDTLKEIGLVKDEIAEKETV